ncbi:MAG: hypothetical protein ACRC35_09580 [Angustibacter sp.]
MDPTPAEEALLDRVGVVFDTLDPVPGWIDEAARVAFTMRDLDAALIPLVDSVATTAVREHLDDGDSQWISFALDDLEIDVGSQRGRDGWRLVGQVTGPIEVLTVQTMSTSRQVAVDEFGRFRADVDAGTMCLRARTADGRTLRTQWVLL